MKDLRDWHLARGNLTQAEANVEDIVKIFVGGDSMASSSLIWKTILVLGLLVCVLVGLCYILTNVYAAQPPSPSAYLLLPVCKIAPLYAFLRGKDIK